MEQDYIKNLRKKVGHEPLILNFAGGVLVNDQDEILLQKRSDFKSWAAGWSNGIWRIVSRSMCS